MTEKNVFQRGDYEFYGRFIKILDDRTLFTIQKPRFLKTLLGDVIKGLQTAREKVRFANQNIKKRQSGGFRFIYVFFRRVDQFICFTFTKERATLTPKQAKQR